MRTGFLICLATLLALAALTATATARQERPDAGLTPEEEREANDLARQFVERLRENNDVAPLVEDLFVRDFGARLRRPRNDCAVPMCFVAPGVPALASDDELKRFYVAEFNLYSRTLAHWMALRATVEDEGDEDDLSVENWYPPEVLRVLRGDPVISVAIALEEAEQAAGRARAQAGGGDVAKEESGRPPDEGQDEGVIKNIILLRTATATASEAADLLRAHAPEFSALRRAQRAREAEKELEEFEEIHRPSLETHKGRYLGFPPVTRFVHVRVEPARNAQFTLELVREDGRLRILSAFPVLGN